MWCFHIGMSQGCPNTSRFSRSVLTRIRFLTIVRFNFFQILAPIASTSWIWRIAPPVRVPIQHHGTRNAPSLLIGSQPPGRLLLVSTTPSQERSRWPSRQRQGWQDRPPAWWQPDPTRCSSEPTWPTSVSGTARTQGRQHAAVGSNPAGWHTGSCHPGDLWPAC